MARPIIDLEIWWAANLLIYQRGGEAKIVAARCADQNAALVVVFALGWGAISA